MNIIVVGINHKTTPIEIRERLFLSATQQELLLSELKSKPSIIEAFVLSTCNRVEIYAHVLDVAMDVVPLVSLIYKVKKIPLDDRWVNYFYIHRKMDAVRHLLEVSTGLDSLVLGEEQILGQIKSAFEHAKDLNMFGRYFNVLSNIAIRAGKKARSETKINSGGTSVSWAAVAKAEEILGGLAQRSILVIGAGKMSDLAVGHIQSKSFKKLYLMNRTTEHARFLAQKYGGEVVPFCDMKEILSQVDICICSSGAPHYILDQEVVERIMLIRDHKQIIIIDISMPRNVDPKVARLKNVRLYQIDDLQEVVDSTMLARKESIVQVRSIIDRKMDEYNAKIKKIMSINTYPEMTDTVTPDPIAS